MSDVATQSAHTEDSVPTSSRNKVKQRVAETVKNKLTQLNIDDADSLSNRITEMLAEGNSKEKLNEELTKLIGADKLKSSFVEWLYGYSNVFFPPTPALSEKDDEETEEKTEGAKGNKKNKKNDKETKAKRRSSQTRRRSGSKSSVSSVDTDKSSKSNKKPLSPPASPAPAQEKQSKEKSKRRLSRSASSLDLANKVQTEVMAQAIAIAAAAESNNVKHTRERSGSISSNRSVERRNSLSRKNSISSNASNSERVRCQYWPECNRGDQCKFWHPKELCKKYPNCPNGDKCLYIHPAQPNRQQTTPYNPSQSKHNRTKSDASSVISTASDRSIVECKFGANCNRPDCKYSHPSPAAMAAQIAKKATAAATETLEQTKQELKKHLQEQAQLKANAAKSSVKTNVPCHFFPNCKNPDCPYQHPSPSQAINNLKSKQSNSEFNVPCRYDGNCTRSDCKFIHTNRKNY